MNRAIIGIDLGGTKISGALISFEGTFVNKTEILLKGRGGEEAGALVLQLVTNQLEIAQHEQYEAVSIGICVPGISNKTNNTVWAPNIQGWQEYPLYKELRKAIKNPSLPISIESDRSCYMLGEMWKGCAQGCRNAIFMAVGTGIGIGILANGIIIDGHSGVAGAIGWMALSRPFLPEYVQCGNFEYYASGTGIARAALRLLHEGYESQFLNASNLTAKDVFRAHGKNDPVAVQVINEAINYWGMAVANLVSIFNPEKIIFGGGVFGPAIQFLDEIYDEARKWGQPIGIRQVQLEGSSIQGDAGLLGAGYLAVQSNTRSS